LKLAPTLVNRNASPNQHSKSIGRPETQQAGLPTEEDNGKLRLAILKGEIDVPRGCGAAVGDLSFHPQVGVVRFDVLANVGDQGEYSPYAAIGRDSGVQSRFAG
jgi:hypothetical protein